MKIHYALVLFAFPGLLSAQITITSADMPSAGDTMRHRTTTLPEFDGAMTGAAYEWHFETLTPDVEAADTAVSVESTPFLYQFYFNNPFLYPQHNADLALRGPSFGFQTVSISDLFDYYKKDPDAYRNVGFGATINGVPASVRRMPIDVVYQLPLEFGDSDSGESEFMVSIPTLGAYGQHQIRENVVDGWGTLYLPADTFEVLRVKSVLQRTDTIFIEQFGFGLSFPEPETIEYKWLALGMDQPVLQVNTLADVPTLVRFVYQPEDFSTAVIATEADVPVLFPNPASDQVFVHADGVQSYELIDAQGRVIRSASSGSTSRISIDVIDVPNGIYGIRRAGASAAARLVVAH